MVEVLCMLSPKRPHPVTQLLRSESTHLCGDSAEIDFLAELPSSSAALCGGRVLSNWQTVVTLGRRAILKRCAGLPRSTAEVQVQPGTTTVPHWPRRSAQVRGHGPSEDRHQHVEGQKDLWQTDPNIKRLLKTSKSANSVQDLVKIHPACP